MVKIIENYTLHEQIGEGEYGKVYRGIDSRNKREVAVKVINVKKFKEYPKLEECTLNEIEVLSKIDSPHIVKFIEILKTANNFYFFYEFCNQGTLEDAIKSKGSLSESQALIYFGEILDAFKILSSKHIMHRDLKPSNILLNDGIIKLADFGFCKSLESHRDLAQTMLGSPIYMAPEVLKGEIYTIKADIWSLGVVLYEMLFGFCPFEERSIARLINLLEKEDVQFNRQINPISQGIEDLLKKMLVKDHFKRISWSEVFQYKVNGVSVFPSPMSNNTLKERKSSQPRVQSRPQSRNNYPLQSPPFGRVELRELKNIENLDNRPFSRPSFELSAKQYSTKSAEVAVPSMFKKKQNNENKQNVENPPNGTSKIKTVRERMKKYFKICSEILNFNFCPEATAQLCLKIYQTLQKDYTKLQESLTTPLPTWYSEERNKLNETINIFQEEANKVSKVISGPLITYYVKSLQNSHKENFTSNNPNKEILIHCLTLLDLNEAQNSTSFNMTLLMDRKSEKGKQGDYNLCSKDRLITDLYQKIIRNVI